MSFDPTEHVGWFAAVGAFALWLWRIIALGAQIGKLVEKVDNLTSKVDKLEDRINAHLDREKGD